MRKNIFIIALFVSTLSLGSASAQENNTLLDFVEGYFQNYNTENFEKACEMLSPYKCDPKSAAGVERFAQEYKKMKNGYEAVSLWIPAGVAEYADQYYDIVCVKNTYQYNDSFEDTSVTEVMSYYLQDRADGSKEIVYRVCEEKTSSDGRPTSCPVVSATDYCLGASQKDLREVIKEEMVISETLPTDEAEASTNIENKEKTVYMLLEEIESLKTELARLEKEVAEKSKEESVVTLPEETEAAHIATEPTDEDNIKVMKSLVEGMDALLTPEASDEILKKLDNVTSEDADEVAPEESVVKTELPVAEPEVSAETEFSLGVLSEETTPESESILNTVLKEAPTEAETPVATESEFCDYASLGAEACNGKKIQILGTNYPETVIQERVLSNQYTQSLETDTPLVETEQETDLGFTLLVAPEKINCDENGVAVTGTLELGECIPENAEQCAGYCEKVVMVEDWECVVAEATATE
jgi:hypothetical protein